jgi:diacylglycerol kinase (ATP)
VSSVALLVGPSSGSGRGPAAAAQLLAAVPGATVLQAGSRDGALARARAAVAAGLGTLVAVGGDGTVHLAVQAVAGTTTQLAVVPTGTGNDLAKALGVPTDVEGTVRALDGPAVPIDAVRVGERWFACVLGTGFDAAVNERANRMTWPRGRRRYDLATVLELRTFTPRPVTVTVDGVSTDHRVMLVALGNGPSYGGGLRICPDADLQDGLLDVVVVGALTRRRLLRLFPRLFTGTHVTDRAVTVLRGREVTLTGGDLAVYADGEPFGHLPLTATVVPGALKVLGAHP